jgi:predicted lipoprotein with Yx(FWY)xxD motif
VIPRRITLATVTGLAAALTLTACGGSKSDNAQTVSAGQQQPRAVTGLGQDGAGNDGYGSGDGSSSSGDYGSSGSASKAAGVVSSELKVINTKLYGHVAGDQKGWTLYRFDDDTADPSKSNCDGACAAKWPPILAKDTPKLKGIARSQVGTVVRSDGQVQLTIHGWPVYRFAADGGPAKTKGVGVGGKWFAITATGKKAVKCLPGMSNSANSALQVKQTKALGPIVVDGVGMALYRFDQDKAGKPSTCNGACTQKWPALMWPGKKPALRGIDPSLVTKIRRSDGTWQVAIAGWPAYHYALDQKAGDWKGEGVGGVWWAFQPSGKKAMKVSSGGSSDGDSSSGGYSSGGSSGGYSGGGY